MSQLKRFFKRFDSGVPTRSSQKKKKEESPLPEDFNEDFIQLQELLGDDVFNDSGKNLPDDILPSVDSISYPESSPVAPDIAVSTSTSIIPLPIPPQDLNCAIDSCNNDREEIIIITPMPSPISSHDQNCDNQFCIYYVNHIHSLPLHNYENLGTPSEFGTVSNVPTPSSSSSFRTKTFKTDKGEKVRHWDFVIKYTKKGPKRRQTTEVTKHNRQNSFQYFLPDAENQAVKVCKTMFLNTISLSERVVTTEWKKFDGNTLIEKDKRGCYEHKKRVFNDVMIKSVCDHVRCFPVVEAHYVRKHSNKLYLEGVESISRMYKLYCDWFDSTKYSSEAKTKRQYREIVNEHFNLAVHRPKKDKCDICHVYENKNSPTEEDKIAFAKHQLIAQNLKKADKKEANVNKNIIAATFDFQKVLVTPYREVSVLYYKRRLATLNFTVYDLASKLEEESPLPEDFNEDFIQLQELLGDDVFNDSGKNLPDDILPSVDSISYPESSPVAPDIAVSTSTSIIPLPIPPQDLNCAIDSCNNDREEIIIITPMPSPISSHDQNCDNQFCIYYVNHIHSLPLHNYENLGTPSEFGTVSNVPTPSSSSSFRTKTFKTDKGEKVRHWDFVIKYTKKGPKRRQTTEVTKHNRQNSFQYFLPDAENQAVKVCKTMFLNTISLSERVVTTEWKKFDGNTLIEKDKRGCYEHKKRVFNDVMIKSVCDHVRCFPVVEAHYVRKHSNKLYLEGVESISRMYKLYCDWFDSTKYSSEAKTKRQYREIVNEHFNLAVHRPKKDKCDICHVYENKNSPTEEDKIAFAKHQLIAQNLKKADKKEANVNKNIIAATFDFQKVLVTPYREVSVLYYKRRLATLNFTVYDLASKLVKNKAMEQLSRAEFSRLSATERKAYLKKLLGENDSDSSAPSDSDDEDWIPANTARRHQIANHEDNSEHDEPEDSEDTGEIAEGNSEVEEEVENSESEEDDEEVETAEPEGRGAREPSGSFIAKDKTVWSKTPLTQHQTAAHNIVRQRSGPHRSTEMLSISETFKKIFTYEMVDIIVRHTNKATYQHYNADHPDSPHQWKPITIPETYSFFGILICAGANNSNMDHTFDMWHSNSYPLYRATIGLKRFHNILRFLRFDDGNTRSQRKKKRQGSSNS
ncbi:unnamed protein product [Arctia plantaginis]|uniref:PiggyBac transposable element-derived protein domain-containing protein n=1 Tax=Arctia plantaginis TaxID=874455 RepID=A0A8S0YP53_ARCPL|nr:unnamed protein product [Arctia plantaginis]